LEIQNIKHKEKESPEEKGRDLTSRKLISTMKPMSLAQSMDLRIHFHLSSIFEGILKEKLIIMPPQHPKNDGCQERRENCNII